MEIKFDLSKLPLNTEYIELESVDISTTKHRFVKSATISIWEEWLLLNLNKVKDHSWFEKYLIKYV